MPGEISITRYADDTTLMAKSEELKSLLMEVKEESEKIDLKLNITSWQIDGEIMETVKRLYFGGLQNHCSW